MFYGNYGLTTARYLAEREIRTAPVIDWSAASGNRMATDDAKKKQKGKQADSWLSDFLGINPPPSLADSTGLSVTTPVVEEPKAPFAERRQSARVAPEGATVKNER